MNNFIFSKQQSTYKVVILIKESAFDSTSILHNYINPILNQNNQLTIDDFVALDLEYNAQNKAPVKLMKNYLSKLMVGIDSLETELILVADSNYFKRLTGETKSEPHYGNVLPCALEGYEHINIVLAPNYQSLLYNAAYEGKLSLANETVVKYFDGTHKEIGADIIHSCEYPDTFKEIQEKLEDLLKYKSLACDIEAFSLKFNEAGIGTISFAWDKHNGIAFCVDYVEIPYNKETGEYGKYQKNKAIHSLLKIFFEKYEGTLIYQNANYDCKILTYELFMDALLDNIGMLEGIDVLTNKIEDTKLITYLATNNTSENELGLKYQAQEFAGNYAEDVKDIRKVPKDKLLKYNLIDALCTWYVFDKHMPTLISDNQEEVYRDILIPSIDLLIQVELTGMPINMDRVLEVEQILQDTASEQLKLIEASSIVDSVTLKIQQDSCDAANKKLKVKVKPLSDFEVIKFNPKSPNHLTKLIYEEIGLPVKDKTDTGAPSTKGKTISKMINNLKSEFGITEEDLK